MAETTILERTLAGLEAGLHVRDIATYDPVSCMVHDLVAEVWAQPGRDTFDAMPVKDDGRVVGLLERPSCSLQGTARDRMRILDDSILVSADLPLGQFIPLAGGRSSRLVVTNDGINAIVTPSDLSKLPVRIFIFTLITHLESLMADLIEKRCENDANWLSRLSPGRQRNVRATYDELHAQQMERTLLDCTYFCDKSRVVCKLCDWSNKLEDQFKEIEKLRNAVAHSGNYLNGAERLAKMLKTITLTEHWIHELACQIKLTV